MLSDLAHVKIAVGVPPTTTDTTLDAKLVQCLTAADATVKRYCKRLFETQVIQEFPLARGGGEALVLQETPVLCYRLNGTIISGQPTITGLSSTSNLFAGMPVLQAIGTANNATTQPFPNGVTIASVDSASQVTFTGNATQTLTNVPFLFGLAVWLDMRGSYGDGVGSDPSGPFGPLTLLNAGLNYALQRDQPDGSSKSGKLTRLGSLIGPLGMGGAWNSYGSAWGGFAGRGTLTSPLPPLWGKWPPGSVKVVYAAGLGYGAAAPSAAQPLGGKLPETTTLPYDLTMAVNAVATWMWRNVDSGLIQMQSESFQGYNASLATAVDALKTDSELGSTRQILSRFRKVAL